MCFHGNQSFRFKKGFFAKGTSGLLFSFFHDSTEIINERKSQGSACFKDWGEK